MKSDNLLGTIETTVPKRKILYVEYFFPSGNGVWLVPYLLWNSHAHERNEQGDGGDASSPQFLWGGSSTQLLSK